MERGDFGRVKQHSAWNDIVATTGSVAAGLREEPSSSFPFTDDEVELRARARRFLVPAHERAWFERALADLAATRVLPPDTGTGDRTTYFRALAGDGAASPSSRYRRLSEDASADMRLVPGLEAVARRVLVADRVRAKTLGHAQDVSERDAADAFARVAENRCLLAWIVTGLDERLLGYRYALEHLVIETPQADAVPAERSLSALRQTRAALGGFGVAPLAEGGCLGPQPDRPLPVATPIVAKG